MDRKLTVLHRFILGIGYRSKDLIHHQASMLSAYSSSPRNGNYTIPCQALAKDITHGRGDTQREIVIGMGQGDGLQWTNVGSTEPKKGRFRRASAGLTARLQQGLTCFTSKEWVMHGISNLERDDYVLAGHNYYVANGNGSELYILNYWALSRGSVPRWITGDNVGRYSRAGTHNTPSNPFMSVHAAVTSDSPYWRSLANFPSSFACGKMRKQTATPTCQGSISKPRRGSLHLLNKRAE